MSNNAIIKLSTAYILNESNPEWKIFYWNPDLINIEYTLLRVKWLTWFKIFEGITPNYLSDLFVKADTSYDTRDKCKLIQPFKRTTTYGLRYFQHYRAHVWNMIPLHIKAAQSLHEFKSLIRSWPGPTWSCHICKTFTLRSWVGEMSRHPKNITRLWFQRANYIYYIVSEADNVLSKSKHKK